MSEYVSGATVTTATTDGPARLDQAIESYLASRADTAALLKRTIAEDPEHLMARCFMGYLTRLAGDARNAERSRLLHRELLQQLGSGAGTAWEQAHATALGLWLADELEHLTVHFEQVLREYPDDVLALRMLHYVYFYAGDAVRMRDSVAAHLHDFAGHPLEGYVKGMLAFGLEECGEYQAAERFGREAVEANPGDAWAAHAVAHVLEMQGRHGEGIRWIREHRPRWTDANNFRFHLSWHEALYHLARGHADAVLTIYDREIGPAVEDDFYLDMCNAASLLLRLEAAGVNVGERWMPLAAMAERHLDDAELVFASLHYLMPLVRTGSFARDRLLARLARWAEQDSSQGRVVRDVALDAAAFLVAADGADPAAASAHFERCRRRLHRIGGSHAQRRLFAILHEAL